MCNERLEQIFADHKIMNHVLHLVPSEYNGPGARSIKLCNYVHNSYF